MKLIAISVFLLCAGCASIRKGGEDRAAAVKPGADESPEVTLDALLAPVPPISKGVNDLRAQMLTDGGRTAGFRGGMVSRARVLAAEIERKADRLDRMFQFVTLVDRGGTLPPVIVEARDVASFAPDQIRTADRVYKIQREERFVSVPPTWRDYLFAGLPVNGSVELPAFEALPKDAGETALWRPAVRSGWSDGERQADAVLDVNFKRLTRDFTGMLLYASLRQQGIITGTQVAELAQSVGGDQKQLVVGDKLKRVTDKARFETEPRKWRATLAREAGAGKRQSKKAK